MLTLLNGSVADALEFVDREQIPELPDRIIAATAFALCALLIGHGQKIRASKIPTIWQGSQNATLVVRTVEADHSSKLHALPATFGLTTARS